jgi:hypothetical protein
MFGVWEIMRHNEESESVVVEWASVLTWHPRPEDQPEFRPGR